MDDEIVVGSRVRWVDSPEGDRLGPAIVLAIDHHQGDHPSDNRPAAWIKFTRGDYARYRSVDLCDLQLTK